jgi:Zn-dependent membrane protease YugP
MNSALIWLLLIVVMVLSFVVQTTLEKRFARYSKVPTSSGMTGADIAREMLRQNGITDVQVSHIRGRLTDHYNPQTKTVNLSDSVYNSNSIAAAAVAAHECGHVVQHATGYAPLKLRTALVPVVSFCNNIVQWVLLAGVILVQSLPQLLWIGIILFAATTLFSLVTLPVEINASQRAVAWLEQSGIATAQTKPMAVDALKWAAYTYVIAAIGSLATLFYYISIASSNRR